MSVQLKREKFLEHFANQAKCLIGMSTGARIRMLDISQRGGACSLRTVLIHGARSVIAHSRQPTGWVTNLTRHRPANVAVVALVNEMARTIRALLAHDRVYHKG